MSRLTSPPAPVRRKGFEPDGTERWYVLVGEDQTGPYAAAEMAQRLDAGALEWSTPVWRHGLRDWRPARRDAVLVTSVAGERGLGSDTLRFHSASSFVAQEDTVVDRAPPSHDTTRMDGPPEQMQGDDTLPSVPPPPPTGRVLWGGREPTASWAGDPRPPSSSTTVLRLGRFQLRIPHSFISVGAVSFAAGVLAAALWARVLGRPDPLEVLVVPAQGVDEPAAPSASAAAPPAIPSASAAALPAPPNAEPAPPIEPPPMPSAPLTAPTAAESTATELATATAVPTVQPVAPLRSLPSTAEIRDALREAAPAVRRCLAKPKLGVDLAITFAGEGGQVSNVRVRRPKLPVWRARCVVRAVSAVGLEPFAHDQLTFPYRFAW